MRAKELDPGSKDRKMGIILDNLMQYVRKGNEFIFRILTDDKTRVHPFTPETNATSMTEKHLSKSVRKRFKESPSVGKVVTTVFRNAKCVILFDFLHQKTINVAHYYDSLTNSCPPFDERDQAT
ncbi:histone-lysine N-methyltransferase SETMAR [Nephila pilipes]|uniref:Histone-lysine N-methyltransferase SETMAR n=1 Tax=Nephila pilipes TaxID=299642 RepID=A0A8X6IQP9_NEPPI|nr:histone-lysine N-methyltransferase SETMAR [Nephila pilipes]